jgi:hypothetical protein
MASIILSFVGNQDPVSDNTREEGSIVALINHLLEQGREIRQIILLYTVETKDRAELTQGWLEDDPFKISSEKIKIIAVDNQLSKDPINLLIAVQEARRGLEFAQHYIKSEDELELNASSGTPVMKSAWSILQAAGYAPNSTVWQVRNPQKIQARQERVVETNIV